MMTSVSDVQALIKDLEEPEERLHNQFKQDKKKAVTNNFNEIKRVKSYLKKAKKGSEHQVTLEKWLAKLEVEQVNLLRDEILNVIKADPTKAKSLSKVQRKALGLDKNINTI